MTEPEKSKMSQRLDFLFRICWLIAGTSITVFGALIVLFEPDIEQLAFSQEFSKSELIGFFFLFIGVMFATIMPAKKSK